MTTRVVKQNNQKQIIQLYSLYIQILNIFTKTKLKKKKILLIEEKKLK